MSGRSTRREFGKGLGLASLVGFGSGKRTRAAVCRSSVGGESHKLEVDADLPGGNIVVEEIEGDRITVHQDLRDTAGWWFYWYFRVRNAAGRKLYVTFTKGDVFSSRGPACSLDGGRTWRWLGRGCVRGTTFTHAVPDGAVEVRYCFAIPYVPADLERFLRRHGEHPSLQVLTHCRTRKGRRCVRLHLGNMRAPKHRVLLTCRHHACEMMASYVLEGIMETVLDGRDDSRWFCENVELAVVPMMDRDGVEDGDQGKNRRPHDHNRDYLGESIYPEVRALKEFAPRWSEEKLRVFLDLHCPYIRDRHIYLVGSPNESVWGEIQRFSVILEGVQSGPLRFDRRHNLPFGRGWNTLREPRMAARWAESLPGVRLASTLEFPYASVGSKEVNRQTARLFGRDVARAIRHYLEQQG